MESVNCHDPDVPPSVAAEGNPVIRFSGSGVGKLDASTRTPSEHEWHSIPLEDSSRVETEYCFRLIEGRESSQQTRNLELSLCGLSKFIGGDGSDETEALTGYAVGSKKDGTIISLETSDALSGVKEVRLSFHGLEDPKNGCEKAVQRMTSKPMNDPGSIFGYGDEGCLPLLHQVRAFIKGAKLSCSGLLSGDSRAFMHDGWGSFLQRSFSFKSCDSSSTTEGESLCKKSTTSPLIRATSSPAPMTSPIPSTGSPDTLKAGPLQARDLQSRAEALPLAHYKPTDGVSWKEGDLKTGQSSPGVVASKSPIHSSCKKPPKPPRHPGRSASLDSATLSAQRAAKKSRDRASAKRKSRAASAAAGTGVTPLVALVLTVGFGILMVFQGVFVQTSVAYGRNVDKDFVDVAGNLRSSLATQRAVPYGNPYRMDPRLAASLNIGVGKSSEVVLSDAFHKSMKDLQWSRSSLESQVKSVSE